MKRLNKDILIAGRIRNLDTATLPALETQVRIDIYSLTGGYWKNFRIRQVADREIEFSFERTLNDPRILTLSLSSTWTRLPLWAWGWTVSDCRNPGWSRLMTIPTSLRNPYSLTVTGNQRSCSAEAV